MSETHDEDADLGVCGRMLDEHEEVFCSRKATCEIIVKNIFGKFLVPLCTQCDNEHRKFYSERRRAGRGRRVHSRRRGHVRVTPVEI